MRTAFRYEFWGPIIGKHIEIWCESRGFAGSIERTAGKWRCSLVPFGGQPSDSLLFQCAMRMQRRDRPTWVLYCGDLDPHGMLIEDVPRRKLREQWGCDPEWTRLLVTTDQIASYKLPTDETGEIVQAEAFPVQDVIRLIDDAFSSIASQEALDKLRHREKGAMDALAGAAERLDNTADLFGRGYYPDGA